IAQTNRDFRGSHASVDEQLRSPGPLDVTAPIAGRAAGGPFVAEPDEPGHPAVIVTKGIPPRAQLTARGESHQRARIAHRNIVTALVVERRVRLVLDSACADLHQPAKAGLPTHARHQRLRAHRVAEY